MQYGGLFFAQSEGYGNSVYTDSLGKTKIDLKNYQTPREIMKLQKRLGITEDGIIGPQTRQAVASFNKVIEKNT